MASIEGTDTAVNVDVEMTNDDQGNVHTFDDMESMTQTTSDADLMKEAAKYVKNENKPQAEAKDTQIEDHKTNAEKSDDLADDITEEIVEEIKMLQASRHNQGYEVPADAMFNAKVDGEERDVSLQDLLNDYSGREKWEPAFKELSDHKKQFDTEKAEIEGYVNTFRTKLEQGSKMDALEYFASMAGQNPLEFRKAMRTDIIREYQEYMNMSPEQQQQYEREEKISYQERTQASEAEQLATEKAQYESQKVLNSLQESLGVTAEGLDEILIALEEDYDGDITEEVVREYHSQNIAYETATSMLDSYDSTLLENDKVVDAVIKIAQDNPDFTAEDYRDVFAEAFKPVTKKTNSKKLKGTEVNKDKPKEQSDIVKNASKLDAFFDFDQLDD